MCWDSIYILLLRTRKCFNAVKCLFSLNIIHIVMSFCTNVFWCRCSMCDKIVLCRCWDCVKMFNMWNCSDLTLYQCVDVVLFIYVKCIQTDINLLFNIFFDVHINIRVCFNEEQTQNNIVFKCQGLALGSSGEAEDSQIEGP